MAHIPALLAPEKEGQDASPKATGSALVPYHATPPALTGVGDLDAFLRFAEQAPFLSPEEERELALAVHEHNDRDALQKLIISHLRLVIAQARNFLGYGLPFADLIQEGNIGLMKAVAHFDPARGNRLTTFAVYWIRSEIQEYVIRNWRMVKTATTKNQRKLFFNLRRFKEDPQLALTYSQAEHIAQTLDVKPQEVLDMEQRLYGQDTSLDVPAQADEDSGFTPADWLTNEDDTPEALLAEAQRQHVEEEGIYAALADLDPRSRRVIEARYLQRGDDGQAKAVTLQALAAELGVSSERVRQIEKAALKKLKHSLADAQDLY